MVWKNQVLMQAKDVVLIIGAVSGLATAALATFTKPIINERRLYEIESSMKTLDAQVKKSIPDVAELQTDVKWIKKSVDRIERKLDSQ
jgi:outer membrane murein-binding lipoprotein Lpp